MKRAWSRKNLWESLSPGVRQAVGQALSVVPPAMVLGGSFRRWLRLARESNHWTAEQARAYQLGQLRRILGLAYERTEYYRQAFDAAGFHPGDLNAPEEIAGLPFLDKAAIGANAERMCTLPTDSPGVDLVSTGGSTGSPLHFYIGANRSAFEYAHLVAGWERAGYCFKSAQAVFRGKIVEPDETGLRHEYDPLLRRHYYSNFHMTDADVERYLDHIETIGPCCLHVYPSSAAVLARHLLRSGRRPPPNIHGILAGSENLYPADRALIERAFELRCFSWYGHSEKLVLAAECEHSTDYHVWPAYGYLELIDEEGRPVRAPGERGEIVGTGFVNTIMPFIRYRTGDYATYAGACCEACGREHMLIREVLGHRTHEMLVAADGGLISWTAVNMHDDTFENVRQFQFRQDVPGRATLRIVPAGGFTTVDRERLERNLRRKLVGRLDVEIELVEEIRLTARGKITYVDQQLSIERGIPA